MSQPRLQQLPFFVAPELEATVAALPAELRKVARGLRLYVIADSRTWLEVAAAAAQIESVTLEELLDGDRHKGPAAARHRAWYDCYMGMAFKSYPRVARAFSGARQLHHTTILAGVRRHAQRLAGELAAAEAVEQYVARQQAPANGTAPDLARTG